MRAVLAHQEAKFAGLVLGRQLQQRLLARCAIAIELPFSSASHLPPGYLAWMADLLAFHCRPKAPLRNIWLTVPADGDRGEDRQAESPRRVKLPIDAHACVYLQEIVLPRAVYAGPNATLGKHASKARHWLSKRRAPPIDIIPSGIRRIRRQSAQLPTVGNPLAYPGRFRHSPWAPGRRGRCSCAARRVDRDRRATRAGR